MLICQNLKELGIDGANNLQKDIALVPISKLHQLTTLNLSNSINVTANGFSLLFRKRNLEFLQNLNLSCCIQVDDSVSTYRKELATRLFEDLQTPAGATPEARAAKLRRLREPSPSPPPSVPLQTPSSSSSTTQRVQWQVNVG